MNAPGSAGLSAQVRVNPFPVEDGELVVGGMSLRRLAARVGRTPFYAYDRGLIAAHVRALRALLLACFLTRSLSLSRSQALGPEIEFDETADEDCLAVELSDFFSMDELGELDVCRRHCEALLASWLAPSPSADWLSLSGRQQADELRP